MLAALALAWLADLSPWEQVHWNLAVVGQALLGTVPLFAVYRLARKTRLVAIDLLGQALSLCRLHDLILLAALAGLGEELLFRGVLQPWFERVSPLAGLILTNVLFGLMHAVTLSYAVIAGLIGLYLSWLAYGVDPPNLLRPIITHAAYDFVAFLLIVREYRRLKEAAHETTASPPG